MQRAIEASKAESSTSGSRTGTSSAGLNSAQSREEPRGETTGNTTSAFLSERAMLEKERLERQKRVRREAGLDDEDEGSSKKQHVYSSPELQTHERGGTLTNAAASGSSRTVRASDVPTIDQIFWEGEVRQTANRHAEPRKDGQPTFRLTEVLGKVCPNNHELEASLTN